jgi:hypothetical protein
MAASMEVLRRTKRYIEISGAEAESHQRLLPMCEMKPTMQKVSDEGYGGALESLSVAHIQHMDPNELQFQFPHQSGFPAIDNLHFQGDLVE